MSCEPLVYANGFFTSVSVHQIALGDDYRKLRTLRRSLRLRLFTHLTITDQAKNERSFGARQVSTIPSPTICYTRYALTGNLCRTHFHDKRAWRSGNGAVKIELVAKSWTRLLVLSPQITNFQGSTFSLGLSP
jgi:hypothetical protein